MANINSRMRLLKNSGWLAVVSFLAGAGLVSAGDAQTRIFAARAGTGFHHAQIRYQSVTNDPSAAWQFGRACFDFADFATNDTGRAAIARQGITACRELLARETNSAPGHYYLAMNYGQLARAEAPSLAAYKLVREIEREFKIAAHLDPRFDYAGPERNLGLLYRDAPGWPVSIGSKRKARSFLDQAATLAPDYPENRLNLAESFLQWRESEDAGNELKTLDSLWPQARTNFAGEAWERSWDDWSTRREAARNKLEEISAPVKPPKMGR
jgi:hypothetical protein